MKAVIIKTDGSKEIVEFDNDNAYGVLSGAVDGYIQQVPLDDIGVTMYCNEEGKLHGLPQNPIATALWIDQWGETDVMVGDVICVSDVVDQEGYETSLTDEQIAYLMEYDKAAVYGMGDMGTLEFVYNDDDDDDVIIGEEEEVDVN